MTTVPDIVRTERADPVLFQVIKGSLRSCQHEMETLLARTAMSPFIREKKDYFAALFDPDGKLVVGTNVFIFGAIIEPILEHYAADEMRPGDLYWYNDCYGSNGAISHSPDQVFVAPVFAEGRLSGFAHSWAHFNDIGGLRPGSLSPDATDIFQEGIIVPPVRLAREGVVNDDAVRIFVRNSRFPEMVRGDMRAAIAAVRLGERRLIEMFDRHGRDTVLRVFDGLIEETRGVVNRRFTETFKPGTYTFVEKVDRDGQGHGPFAIKLRMSIGDDGVVLDATDTDDQAPGPINFLMSPHVPRMIFAIYLLSNDLDVMLNHGALSTISEVRVRPGSLLQPMFPAPLGQRGITMVRVMTACLGLVNVATDCSAMASSNVYVIYYLRGTDPSTQAPFLLTDGIAVGYGARPFADGTDAIYLVGNENYPVEFLDLSYPVRLLRYTINADSGGPGRWRGGCGVVRELEVLAEQATLSIRIDSIDNPPWGMAGGQSGRGGSCVVNPGARDERVLEPLSDGAVLRKGDVIRIETGGGGGWGHPWDREPERVMADVLGGFISASSARDEYAVAIASDNRTIDEEGTATLRRNRYPVKMFHRRVYCDRLE